MTSSAHQSGHGLVYVPDVHTGPMAHAEAGRTVRIPGRGPPWIAVDHDISTVVMARWPGRLWLVEIVDPITDRDLRAAAEHTLAHATRLAERRHSDAGDAQTRLWRRWLARENIPLDRYPDLDGTLAMRSGLAG